MGRSQFFPQESEALIVLRVLVVHHLLTCFEYSLSLGHCPKNYFSTGPRRLNSQRQLVTYPKNSHTQAIRTWDDREKKGEREGDPPEIEKNRSPVFHIEEL